MGNIYKIQGNWDISYILSSMFLAVEVVCFRTGSLAQEHLQGCKIF